MGVLDNSPRFTFMARLIKPFLVGAHGWALLVCIPSPTPSLLVNYVPVVCTPYCGCSKRLAWGREQDASGDVRGPVPSIPTREKGAQRGSKPGRAQHLHMQLKERCRYEI